MAGELSFEMDAREAASAIGRREMKIGIIGTGWGARTQVPAFRSAGLEVSAIAGRDPAKTRKAAGELSLEAFDDWRDLVAAVDLVSIVTPPVHHHKMALAAIEAGKHVLCEKPTAVDAREAEEMLAAATAHPQQMTLIDHELRFLPSWRAALGRIGELGQIRFAEVRYSSPSRADASRPWNWWNDRKQGGGSWGAVGSHYTDALRYFIGEIEAVQAVLNTFVRKRPLEGRLEEVTSDDFAAVHLRLQHGILAMMSFSSVSAVDEPTVLTIHGEGGAFRFTGADWQIARSGGPFELQSVPDDVPASTIGNSKGGAFGSGTVYLGRALRSALIDGDREALAPAATFADGLAQQRVLDAARHSQERDGRWVALE
jgi:predicted dehydrogenase